ncbi:hypothetical protein [Pseudoroseicyclus sp. CXY001]
MEAMMAQRIRRVITKAEQSWLGEAVGAAGLFLLLFAALQMGGFS